MDKINIKQRNIAAQTKKKWVRLTRMCNNHCLFCLDNDAQDGSYLPFDDIKKVLSTGRKEAAGKVILSGGEPTLHPEFINIVKTAKKMGYTKIQVITNGRMFAYKKFLDQAVDAGVSEITFSMHGHNRELHDKQTEVKGSFLQALSGLIAALKKNGLIVNVDIVINKINIRYLADIIKFYVNLGISEFDLLQVMPFGRAWDNKDILFYDISARLNDLKKALSLSGGKDLWIWTNRLEAKYLEGFEQLMQHPVKLYDEINGRKRIFTDFLLKGKIMECAGERCNYCFLHDFCSDLKEFKVKGKLTSKNGPFCLEFESKKNRKKEVILTKIDDIFKFLDFYIKHRYYVKSLRCKECKLFNSCSGLHIEEARNSSFSKLKPVLNSSSLFLQDNKPYDILRIGLSCNANCAFYNVPSESFVHKQLTIGQIKKEISEMIFRNEQLRLDITGGEPTIRKDLTKIINYAANKGVKTIQVQTNALKLSSRKYTKELREAGLNKVFVALHSSVSAIHDELVGVKGAFNKCIKGISNALSVGLDVVLNPVVTNNNYKELIDYIEFIKKEFPDLIALSLSVVQPRGRAWDNKNLIPRYKTIDPYVRRALKLAKDYKIVVINPYCGLPLCIGGWDLYLNQCVEYCDNIIRLRTKQGLLGHSPDKVKGPKCRLCGLKDYCNGVWKEYSLMYPLTDLIPLEKNSGKFRLYSDNKSL